MRPLDRRTDVFAMGTVLWEGLTGARLFRGHDLAETIAKVQSMPVAPPWAIVPGAPRHVSACAMRALERDPARRYPSAEAMRVALVSAASSDGWHLSADVVAPFVDGLVGAAVRERIRRATSPADDAPPAAESRQGASTANLASDARTVESMAAPGDTPPSSVDESFKSARDARRDAVTRTLPIATRRVAGNRRGPVRRRSTRRAGRRQSTRRAAARWRAVQPGGGVARSAAQRRPRLGSSRRVLLVLGASRCGAASTRGAPEVAVESGEKHAARCRRRSCLRTPTGHRVAEHLPAPAASVPAEPVAAGENAVVKKAPPREPPRPNPRASASSPVRAIPAPPYEKNPFDP